MRREPNLAISGWFREHAVQSRPWIIRSNCRGHQSLPWTSDNRPSMDEYAAMNAVCIECPVIAQCAAYALVSRSCGFYAGVWLPWHSSAEGDNTKAMRYRAKRQLKALTV